MVPVAAHQPALARQLAVEVAQALAELGLVGRVLQRHLGQAQPGAQEVNVAVVKPGQDAPALQVEDARVRPDERADVGVAADDQDAVAADGHGLGFGLRAVDGPDLAVEQDQVRDDRGGRSVGAEGRAGEEEQR